MMGKKLRSVNVFVRSVVEHFEKVHVSGSGADAVFKSVSRGWFVAFDGSYEANHFGETEPDLKVGDIVRISYEKLM